MKKQQKFRIVSDLSGMFTVEELQSCCWIKRFIAGKGKDGLERAEEWLANRKD